MTPLVARFLRSTTLLAGLAGAALSAQAGVSVGIQLGLPAVVPAGGVGIGVHGGWGHGRGHGYYRGGWWGPVVVSPWLWPSAVVVVPQPVPAPSAADAPPPPAATPMAPTRPEPIVYPRNGQSPEQTEADRQACNRWATTQPAAMADASVFQRAVEACMDGRGYTLK